MLTLTWDAIRPTPVHKGELIEPEATDRHVPRPWWYLPPGSTLLIGATGLALGVAGLQSSVRTVRDEGLPLPVQVPVISKHLAPKHPSKARLKKRNGKLHRALQKDHGTPWANAS